MKRLLITALLGCTIVRADPLAVTPNVIGGYTFLTDEPCQYNSKYLQAYATNDKSDIFIACYYVEKEVVHFILKDGKLRKMPLDRFEPVSPKLRT
jgi:hypothetical protein